MHGAGNDFVVIDATRQAVSLSTAQLQALADRRLGVGCDQILLVGPAPATASGTEPVDFSYRIFNSDGGEVEQCGNGARAFVRFVHAHGLSEKRALRVQTSSGIITPSLADDDTITVDMGEPILEPARIPFDHAGLEGRPLGADIVWPLDLEQENVLISVVSMGNPHAIQDWPDVSLAPVTRLGPQVERHWRFTRRVNAGFSQWISRHEIRLRVWERGAGETLACGTGACAAVVAGILRGQLDSPVRVQTRGGELAITWGGAGHSVFMSGPAVLVYEGEIELHALTQAANTLQRTQFEHSLESTPA